MRRRVPPQAPERAHDRGKFLPTLREHGDLRPDRRTARLLGPSDHRDAPRAIRRGIEIAAEVADSPVSVITTRSPRCSGAHGRPLPTARIGGPDWRVSGRVLCGGHRWSTHRLRRGGRPGERRGHRIGRAHTSTSTGAGAGGRPGRGDGARRRWVPGGPRSGRPAAHLREPGAEEARRSSRASRAARPGRLYGVVAMPNTEPCPDSAAVVRHVLHLAKGRAATSTGRAITRSAARGGLWPRWPMVAPRGAHLHRRRGRGAGRRP